MAINEDETVCVDTFEQALDGEVVGKTERLFASAWDEDQANGLLFFLQVVIPDRDSVVVLGII